MDLKKPLTFDEQIDKLLSHGIVISDTTKTIEKVDNVIFVPIKTFSLM